MIPTLVLARIALCLEELGYTVLYLEILCDVVSRMERRGTRMPGCERLKKHIKGGHTIRLERAEIGMRFGWIGMAGSLRGDEHHIWVKYS